MLELFKFVVLCLISTFITSICDSWLPLCVIFIVLIYLFNDFDFNLNLEQHVIRKVKLTYLKVRNLTLFYSEQNLSFYQTATNMNSVDKQNSTFDLSRFSKSGNISPIANNSSGNLTSRKLIQSRQTSTPLSRGYLWQKNGVSPTNSIRTPVYQTTLNRSPRYSLSSTSNGTLNESSTRQTVQTVTGPLLASSRFNVNLGTYTDSKSPGLASRIVQYHNELSSRQTSTHQARYGSPGQFPIVQLYKKELPVLQCSPKRCTVRVAPPDPIANNSTQANSILRNSFSSSTDHKSVASDTEISTKSVLEALKEISRKRIHAGDEIDDISKRQRKDSVNAANTSNGEVKNKDGKRMREYTPPKSMDVSTSPINNAPKRVCVVNEIEGSFSSSIMSANKGQKRKSSLNNSDVSKKQKKVTSSQLVSKYTQTHVDKTKQDAPKPMEVQRISTAAQTEQNAHEFTSNIDQMLADSRETTTTDQQLDIADIDKRNASLRFKAKRNAEHIPVFSDKTLELGQQNKFEILLSALNGESPNINPIPTLTLTDLKRKSTDAVDSTKEVVSILSPRNKVKHDKHVTWNIPNASDSTEITTTESVVTTPGSIQLPQSIPVPTTPVSSTETINVSLPFTIPNFSSPPTQNTGNPPMSFPSAASTTIAPIISTPATQPSFSFGSPEPPKSTVTQVAMTSTTTVNSTTTTPIVQDSNNPKATSFATNTQNGFGNAAFGTTFKPAAFGGLAPATTATPNLIQPTTTTQAVTTNATSAFTNVAAPPTLAFGTPPTAAQQPPAISFGTPNHQPSLTTTTQSAVTTQQNSVITFVATNPPAFGTNTTPATTANMFSFGSKPEVKPATTTTTSASNFTFGSTTVPAQPQKAAGGFKFDLTKPKTTDTAVTAVNKTNSFTFGPTNAVTTTTPTAFGTTSSAAPGFGLTKTTSTVNFGTSITTGTVANNTPNTKSSNIFGASTTTTGGVFGTPSTKTTTPAFGATPISNPGAFGAPITTSSIGGFQSTPVTTTSTSVFGTPSTAPNNVFGGTTATPTFGAAKPTENPPSFAAFGTPNTATSTGFGFNTPTTTQASTFGSFGTPTTAPNAFGANPVTTTNTFAFGSTTTAKPFAFGSTATTTATNMFGTSSPATNSTNIFGAAPNTGFGSTTGSGITFGTPATTTTASSFGQSSAVPVFGTASPGFGTGAAVPVFGASNTTNNPPAFGATAQPSAFGATSQQTSTFGSTPTNQGNVFGTNQTNSFSSATNTNQTNAFGSTSTPSFGGSTGFNGNNTQPPPPYGAFGTPAAPQANQQSGIFAFGSSAQTAPAPQAGTSNAFQFGTAAPVAKPSGFNFSANTNTPNINFGAGTSAFGSPAPAPAFGTPAPGQFNTPAPATGMFSIGSGSTAAKQRPMIKARRRN